MATSFTEPSTTLDRKSLKRPDDFIGMVHQFFDGIGQHVRGFVILVVLLLVAGLAFAVTMTRRQAMAEAAKNALFDAQRTQDSEAKDLAKALAPAKPEATAAKADVVQGKDAAKKAEDPADPAAIAFKKLDVDAKFADAIRKYKVVATDFAGTRSAFEARLKLGDLYFQHGLAAQALPWYRQAVESSPGSFEKALALSAEGYAQEDAGHPAEAYASFEKALNLGEGSIKGDVLMGMARTQEALHDTAKARSIYEQILQQLPNSDYAKAAEMAKAELR